MKRLMVVGAALVLALAAAPSAAGDWHLRGYGVWMDAGVDGTVPSDDDTPISIDTSSEVGFGGSVEYQFNDRLGIEAGVVSASPTIELRAEDLGIPDVDVVILRDTLSTTGLVFDLNLHLTPASSAADFYIGAGVASVSYGSLDFRVPFDGDTLSVRVEDKTSWTAKAALDYIFGDSGWGLTFGLRYIDSETEFSEKDDPPSDSLTLSNDLLVGTFGVVYRVR